MGRLSSTTSGGRLASSSSGGRLGSSSDSSLESLVRLAQQKGLGDEVAKIVNEKPKLSFLQRLGAGLGAFNTANAVITAKEKGLGAGIFEYGKDIAKGIASAVTGTDYQPDRKTYSDVAAQLGVQNGIAKFGLGFVGDVLLDPTTYFGGAIARGVTRGAAGATELGLKGVGRLAPEIETGLRQVGTGLQDAFGRAFVAGYKSTNGAQEDVLSFMSKNSKELLENAAQQLDHLGVRGLSKDQLLEVGLKTALGKQAEFLLGEQLGSRTAATQLVDEASKTGDFSKIANIDKDLAEKLNIQFETEGQQKYFQAQQERARQFAERAGVEDPYSVYMPFLKKQVQDKFVNEIKNAGIQVGSEGYLKQFKNILTTENIELNPVKAFATREGQIITNTNTRKFLEDFVGKYGKPLDAFSSESDAAQAGYKILKEKGGFGKSVGYVGEWDAKLFNDLIRPEFQTINMLAKATGFDAITQLFKRSVTGLFLPFHVRNYLSGAIQNFEVLGVDALNPKNLAAGQRIAYLMGAGKEIPEGVISIGGKSEKFADVMKPFMERFSGDTFYQNDFLTAIDDNAKALKDAVPTFSKETLKETLKTGGLGQDAITFRAARAVGQFIEHQQKATAYITALNQGKSIPEALKLAEIAGFDYRMLTQFESQVMRRIIPFYSFTRKNIELQLRTLGENPQRINQVLAFFQNMGDPISYDEKKSLPDYIKESLGIKLADSPEGLQRYVASFGTPIEAFAQLFGSNPVLRTISQTNPLFKVPIEIGIGKDSFRQKDLKDVYDAREYKSAPQFIKDLLGLKPIEKDVLKKLPDGKLIKTGTRTTYPADPVRLLIARSLFTSRGVTYLDQVFGGDLQGFTKALKTTTGIKPQQVDIEQQKSINASNKERAVEDLLTKYGVTKQFKKTYVPK